MRKTIAVAIAGAALITAFAPAANAAPKGVRVAPGCVIASAAVTEGPLNTRTIQLSTKGKACSTLDVDISSASVTLPSERGSFMDSIRLADAGAYLSYPADTDAAVVRVGEPSVGYIDFGDGPPAGHKKPLPPVFIVADFKTGSAVVTKSAKVGSAAATKRVPAYAWMSVGPENEAVAKSALLKWFKG